MLAAVSVAYGTAILGADLLDGNILSKPGAVRRIKGAALAGSAAAGDMLVELYAKNRLLAQLYNTATGFPTRDHLFPVGADVALTESISAIVRDAAATNPANLLLDYD